jgi:hypothetical protein
MSMASESISRTMFGSILAPANTAFSEVRKPCETVGRASGRVPSRASLTSFLEGKPGKPFAAIANNGSSSSGVMLYLRPVLS